MNQAPVWLFLIISMVTALTEFCQQQKNNAVIVKMSQSAAKKQDKNKPITIREWSCLAHVTLLSENITLLYYHMFMMYYRVWHLKYSYKIYTNKMCVISPEILFQTINIKFEKASNQIRCLT